MKLKLDIEPGLADRFGSMRECFTYCVHQHKQAAVAAALDVAPSNLSSMLSGARHLDPELIERYMREFGDPLPAMFWAARWCRDVKSEREAALSQLPSLMAKLNRVLEQAGQS